MLNLKSKVLKAKKFKKILAFKELKAWRAFKPVYYGLLENIQTLDYQDNIKKLLQDYEDMVY